MRTSGKYRSLALQGLLLSFSVLHTCSVIVGQNLVPNGSFEEYGHCPTSPGEADLATPWQKIRGTSDYFNACNTNDYCDVPRNAFGYQAAASGVSYCGLITYDEAEPDFREFLGVELTEPLIPGVEVHLSFKTSPGGWGWYNVQRFRYSVDNIGMLFTTQVWSGATGGIPNSSVLYLDEPLSDTLNWTMAAGTFTPDSAYRYLMLGNFFQDSHLEIMTQDPTAPYLGAYAFVDDVCVSYSQGPCLVGSGLSEGAKGSLIIGPNPFSEVLMVRTPDAKDLVGTVRDLVGRELWSGELAPSSSNEIHAEQWPFGALLMTIYKDGIRLHTQNLIHLSLSP